MIVKHILVPTDFSVGAEQALDYAVELAQQFQAQLTLLHVCYVPVTSEVNLGNYMAEMELSAQHGLESCQKRAKEAGLEVETAVVYGMPYHDIVAFANAKHPDLIIMGTHGRTGLQHFFLGSVAERVVRLAPCPVMVTRDREDKATL